MASPFAGLFTGKQGTQAPPAPASNTQAPKGAFSGLFSAPPASPARSPAPVAPIAPVSPAAAPSGSPAPASTPSGIPASALKGNLGSGYGTSNATDSGGKPLLTYENQDAKASQLLTDRVAPTFDPTKPEKLTPDMFSNSNGRIPLSVSAPLKTQMGGTYSDELDHKIALELGGSNDKTNLQIEPGIKGGPSAQHDQLENTLAQQVAQGKISLIDAQQALAKAKGYSLPEFGGGPAKQGNPNVNYADANKANGITTPPVVGDSTEANEANNAKIVSSWVRDKVMNPGKTLVNDFPQLTQTLADLQTNPLNLGSSIKDILSTPFKDITQASDAFNSALANLITGIKNKAPASENISNGLQAATSFAGGILEPLTMWFNVANKIPIIGDISKLLFNVPFSALGDLSGNTGVLALNQLPISDQAKKNLEPGIRAVSTLAGQIVGGKYVAVDALDTLQKQFGQKDAITIMNEAHKVAQDAQNKPAAQPEATAKTEETTAQPTVQTSPEGPKPVPTEAPKDTAPEINPTKTSGIAKSIEAKAIEKGLTDKFENLAGFEGKNVKDQASKVADLITNNEVTARDIINGRSPVPDRMSATMLLKGMEDHAMKNGDVELLRQLASSPLTSDTSVHAQELRFAGERDPESAVKAIKDVQSAREKSVKKKYGDVEKAKGKVANDIKGEIRKAAPKLQDWKSFVESIKC